MFKLSINAKYDIAFSSKVKLNGTYEDKLEILANDINGQVAQIVLDAIRKTKRVHWKRIKVIRKL